MNKEELISHIVFDNSDDIEQSFQESIAEELLKNVDFKREDVEVLKKYCRKMIDEIVDIWIQTTGNAIFKS